MNMCVCVCVCVCVCERERENEHELNIHAHHKYRVLKKMLRWRESRSPPSWDCTQRRLVVNNGRFETTSRSNLKGPSSPRRTPERLSYAVMQGMVWRVIGSHRWSR
jgi:hypothetical protein